MIMLPADSRIIPLTMLAAMIIILIGSETRFTPLSTTLVIRSAPLSTRSDPNWITFPIPSLRSSISNSGTFIEQNDMLS